MRAANLCWIILFFTLPVCACELLPHPSGVQILSEQCDIGEGVFESEKKRLRENNDHYWIQCGVIEATKIDETRASIRGITSENMVLSDYHNAFRCLLGPFKTASKAISIKTTLNKYPHFSDAFIRVVSSLGTTAQHPVTRSSQPQNNESSDVIEFTTQQSITPSMPEPAIAEPSIEIFTSVGSNSRYILSMVYLGEPQNYYIEGYQKWSRINYSAAKQVCARNNMLLPSFEQFNDLESTQSLSRFPVILPFWLDDGSAVTRGETQPRLISPLSELNISCLTKR